MRRQWRFTARSAFSPGESDGGGGADVPALSPLESPAESVVFELEAVGSAAPDPASVDPVSVESVEFEPSTVVAASVARELSCFVVTRMNAVAAPAIAITSAATAIRVVLTRRLAAPGTGVGPGGGGGGP